MKIAGFILYIFGFLGIAYIIEETLILDALGGFGSVVFMFVWLALTMGLGKVLIKAGNNNDKKE